jgi:hypothetical protein
MDSKKIFSGAGELVYSSSMPNFVSVQLPHLSAGFNNIYVQVSSLYESNSDLKTVFAATEVENGSFKVYGTAPGKFVWTAVASKRH